jgi:hypothetical protein
LHKCFELHSSSRWNPPPSLHSKAHEQLGRIIAQLNKISFNLISSSKSESERERERERQNWASLNRHGVPPQSKHPPASSLQTEYKSLHLVTFHVPTAVTAEITPELPTFRRNLLAFICDGYGSSKFSILVRRKIFI